MQRSVERSIPYEKKNQRIYDDAMYTVLLGLLIPDTVVWAAVGKTSLSVSSGSVNMGVPVTVTGKASGPAGEKVVATMTLSWDASVLEFVQFLGRFQWRRRQQADQRR